MNGSGTDKSEVEGILTQQILFLWLDDHSHTINLCQNNLLIIHFIWKNIYSRIFAQVDLST